MKRVEPQVFLIARLSINEEGLQAYLKAVGVPDWCSDAPTDAEKLIEVAGRACYRSFEPGLNPNVLRIRKENKVYLENILKVKHGSVIEHANWTFAFLNVSRVFTHELVRHRAGSAFSQESLRFVRLTNIPAWLPPEIAANPDAVAIFENVIGTCEKAQRELTVLYNLDDPQKDFHYKKQITSAMRRVAPIGLATTIIWTVNTRTLRWTIEARTDPGAEIEIRRIFGWVASIMIQEAPNLFSDFKMIPLDDGTFQFKPEYSKV